MRVINNFQWRMHTNKQNEKKAYIICILLKHFPLLKILLIYLTVDCNLNKVYASCLLVLFLHKFERLHLSFMNISISFIIKCKCILTSAKET